MMNFFLQTYHESILYDKYVLSFFCFTGYYNKRYYRPKTIIKKGTFLSRFLTPTVTYELLHFYN